MVGTGEEMLKKKNGGGWRKGNPIIASVGQKDELASLKSTSSSHSAISYADFPRVKVAAASFPLPNLEFLLWPVLAHNHTGGGILENTVLD